MNHRADQSAKYKRGFANIDYIHEYDLDIEKRDIFLFGREEYMHWESTGEQGVEFGLANRFIRNLRILQSLSDEPILIHMKTCGGDWSEGMAIYNALQACPVYCTILNYTHARSMSSLILQAADHRAMMPDATFMFHDGVFSFDGTIKQLHSEFAEVGRETERMMQIYLDVAEGAPFWEQRSRKQISAWMRRQMDKREEVYVPAEDTVSMGFADVVFGADGTYDWASLRGA